MAGENHSSMHMPSAGLPFGRLAWFGDLEQAEFEIEFFERALVCNPEYVDVLRALGEQLRGSIFGKNLFKWYSASFGFGLVMGLLITIADLQLGHARRCETGTDALERAIDFGYCDFGHLELDPDLDSLRHLPEYGALVRRSLRDVASHPTACEVIGE